MRIQACGLPPQRLRLVNPEGGSESFPSDGSPLALRREGHEIQARIHGGGLEVQGALVNGKESPQWTAVPDGGHVIAGTLQDPHWTLFHRQAPEGGPRTDRPLQVTFFGDASVPDIGSKVKHQTQRFEKTIVQAGAPVRVAAVVADGSVLGDATRLVLPFALGAASLGSLGATLWFAIGGQATLPGAVGGALFSLLSGALAYGFAQDSANYRRSIGEKVKAQGDISGQHVQAEVARHGPRQSDFDRLWQKSFSQWPQSRQLVYLSGHGFQTEVAGLSVERLASTVKGAEMVLLDACNGGQVELLARLTDSARVAIASEHNVRGSGFPLERMFGQQDFASDPREMAADMVQAAALSRPASSLVAVDLEVLKKSLLPSLDRLGRQLQRISDGGFKSALQKAMADAETTDQTSPKVDLGSFLENLVDTPGLARRCSELPRTLQALDQTVVAMAGHGTLSFDTFSPSHLPQGWRDFVRNHRP